MHLLVNFQPWRVVIIKNKEKQAKLKDFSYNQQQVEDASAVFLLLGNQEDYSVENYIDFSLKHGSLKPSQVENKRKRIKQYLQEHPEDASTEGLRLDVGLFAMNLMHVVRCYGYESVPMRGVEFKEVMDYLSLDKSLEPILLLPIGKALKDGSPHIRKEVDEFARILK